MYTLRGVIVGQGVTFRVHIDPTEEISDMKKKVKKEKPWIQCHAENLMLYKLDENAPSDIYCPRNEEKEEGVSSTEKSTIRDLKDPAEYGKAYLLEEEWPISDCWSRSPVDARRLHFMVVVPEGVVVPEAKDLTEGLEPIITIHVVISHQVIEGFIHNLDLSFAAISKADKLFEYLKTAYKEPARFTVTRSRTRLTEGTIVEMSDSLQDGHVYSIICEATPPNTPCLSFSQDVCPEIFRSRAHYSILGAVFANHVLHIRAPPGTGKTVIALQLVARYQYLFADSQYHSICDEDVEDAWRMTTQQAGLQGVNQQVTAPVRDGWRRLLDLKNTDRQASPRLLVIDEVQQMNQLGRFHPFWKTLKFFQSKALPVYVIICGVRGEGPSSLNRTSSTDITPIEIQPVDFQTLLLDSDELKAMYKTYNLRTKGLPIDQYASQYINSFLGGHVGLTVKLLQHLTASQPDVNLNAEPYISNPIAKRNACLLFIARHGIPAIRPFRAFSSLGSLTHFKYRAEAREILQTMLLSPEGLFRRGMQTESNTPALLELVDNFFITPTISGWSFVSKFIHYQLLDKWKTDTPGQLISLPLHDMILRILQNMQLKHLQQSISAGQNLKVYEAALQHEFYSSTKKLLTPLQQCDPEVGRCFGSSGKIDFWFLPENFGVELLRNGDKLAEHESRFEGTGRYKDMPLTDYLILNFVQQDDITRSIAEEKKKTLPKLWIEGNTDSINLDKLWYIHWDLHNKHFLLQRQGQDDLRLPTVQEPEDIQPLRLSPIPSR